MKHLAFAALASLVLLSCSQKEQKPIIALTFDDGPNTTVTPYVLDLLEEYGVTASFFLEGRFIDSTTVPVIKRMDSLGCDICNHSFDHLHMGEMNSADSISRQIDVTDSLIFSAIGRKPSFFRPPYISVSDLMHETIPHTFIAGQGCEDWLPEVTPRMRAERVLGAACDGQIILLHDGDWNPPTIEALKAIIPGLLDKGFEFVTVSQLFERKGVTPVSHEKTVWSQVPAPEEK